MSKNTIKNLVRVALEEAQVVINRRCGCKGNPDGVPTPACMASVIKPGNCSTDSDCKGECVPRDGKVVKCPENEFCDPDLVHFKPQKRKSIRNAIKEQCFPNPTPPPIFGNYGCMDPAATNYDQFATHPCNSYGPSNACADCQGNSDYCGPGTAPGDCCDYPPPILGCTDPNASNYMPQANTDNGSCVYGGCTDPTANNYDPTATIDDGSCTYTISGCTDTTANNYNVAATVDDGSCVYDVYGCTDSQANNYDPTATIDDGSCTYDILGCTDQGACNYNPQADTDDGSCEYESCMGCMDSTAINYDSTATSACPNCCVYPLYGCTDSLALNYDPAATVDDGSCTYEVEPEDCENRLDIGCWVCKDPINFPGCQQISNMNQVTMATGYGLQGFNTQQDCINNTECGGDDMDGPCKDINGYILSNYPNYQGSGPLDYIHFCEKCMSGEISDPMCKCCKKDPCDKKYLEVKIQNQYGMMIDEFCKYCKYQMMDDSSCKCCRRFDKLDKKRIKRR